ncbi:MAG: HlyD family efflux transporter periplasmic adaptor subunit [Deltaproteobacteria bacterium]|nr:HlyD family efflux transporter periplasmic adaptor subunit [Deltaproteobacteria bacterium]
MLAPFERTMRALAAERRRPPVAAIVALVLIGAWVAWAVLARVGVYVASTQARIEAREPVHVLRAEVDGRLVAMQATLGLEVAVGDVLYELDGAEADIRRAEALTRASALQAEREVLDAAVSAANEAKASGQDVLFAALAEAKARLGQAKAALAQADREVSRLGKLGPDVSSQELERAKTTAALRRSEVAASQALADRLSAEEAREASDRTAAVERMRGELVRLEAEQATAEADARSAEVARERRRVRAPVAGRLGELPTLRPGDYVRTGQALGTIVPPGELHVVAHFPAERALGWVRRGAPARLRLDAFPWTWFGQIEATVREVALEPRDGHLRVELALTTTAVDIPIGHGLTGGVEVRVEETTPLALLLRASGRKERVASEGTPAPPTDPTP